MDPLFNFGFINALLAGFGPQLARDTELAVKEVGFDGFLLALLQNKDATQLLHRAVARAIDEVKRNKAQLAKTRLAVLSKVQVGARVLPG